MVAEKARLACAAGYDEGTLRAYLDGEVEPGWGEALRAHAHTCDSCSERLSQLRLDGALVQGRLGLLEVDVPRARPRLPVAVVLAAAKERDRAGWRGGFAEAIARLRVVAAPAWRPAPLAAGAAAGVLLLIGAAATQPAVQSLAQGVVQSLRVQRVQPVKLDLSQLSGTKLPGIDQLLSTGTYTGPAQPTVRSATVAEASQATGVPLRAPAKLPAQVTGSRSIWVSDPVNFTFTYDGQKLALLAQQYGVTDATLLAELRGLNGATVKGNVPAVAGVFYGKIGPVAAQAGAAKEAAKQGKATEAARQARTGQANAEPFLALVQVKTPSLDVPSSVNVDQLRQQLLKSGAVPPAVASQLLAIQDWRTTLPIPVIQGTSKPATVDGANGTLIVGEGPHPLLVWQKDGVLYAMSTSGSEQELLDAARSLAPAK